MLEDGDQNNGSKGLKSYRYNVEPKGISYGILEFDCFDIREVNIQGKPNGEYHAKIKDTNNNSDAILFFRRELGGDCEIGLVDPEGILNLEYPIYIKVKDILIDSMNEVFHDINKTLSNHKNKS